ncbi:MAG: knotted carbamoyltransferase YgeW [Planctomycetes bacterium]|nr:knotted carbamoyltransferase YgeW [Planctomycetota bacterium]
MSDSKVRGLIERLAGLDNELHGGDFLLTWSFAEDAIRSVLLAAETLEEMARARIPAPLFASGLGLSIFRDHSTRTRYAFRAACNLLGLMTEELNEETSQISHGETVRETATMISFLTEVIGIRDDMFLGAGHAYMAEVARAVDESHAAGVLLRRPAVINLQCDLDHPTQSLADLMHLAARFGGLEQLRGRKLVMSWAYSPSYGKPLSVPQGVVALMTRFGMDVVLACPEGYDLAAEPLAAARHFAAQSKGSFAVTHAQAEAFDDADAVYPKSWAPYAVMERRTELLRARRTSELKDLEREALAENARHRDWTCTRDLLARTRGGNALYMHCLPADVSGVSCAEGEVSEEVFDKHRLDTYRQASRKPFVIAAMILLARFENPAAALSGCL